MKDVSLEFGYHSGNKNIGIVRISGAIDLSNAAQLSEFLDKSLVRPSRVLIFNLHGLKYMNSTGLGTLWKALDESGNRRILFTHLEKNIYDIFHLMGLNQVFEIFPDMDKALQIAYEILGESASPEITSANTNNQESVVEQIEQAPREREIPEAQEVSRSEMVFPVVKPCPACEKLVNFRKEGHYRCPHCQEIHYVNEVGEVNIISSPLAPSLPSVPKAEETPDIIEITLSSDPHHLGKIRDFITSFTRDTFSEEACANLAMAVDEACGNAIEHAHKFDRMKKLYMSVYIDNQKFSITIADSGENTFREDLIDKELGNVKKTGRGMGFYLMKQMMDEVSLARTEQGGTAITLVKYSEAKN